MNELKCKSTNQYTLVELLYKRRASGLLAACSRCTATAFRIVFATNTSEASSSTGLQPGQMLLHREGRIYHIRASIHATVLHFTALHLEFNIYHIYISLWNPYMHI